MTLLVLDVVNSDPIVCFDHHSTTRNRLTVHQYRYETTRQTCDDDARTVPRIG